MLDLVPGPVMGWLRAVAAIAAVLAVAWAAVKLEQHGADRIQAKWNASKLADQAAVDDQRREDARINGAASANHQAATAAALAALRRNKGALDDALQRASQCGPTAGDMVLPGELGMHLNEISAAGSTGAAGSEPVDAVRPGPGLPD